MTSTQSGLIAWLRRRIESRHQAIEETAAGALRRLAESLRGVVDDALSTIEADTAAAVGRQSALPRRAWLRPLVIGLIFSLGIIGSSRPGTHWLWTTIEQQIEALAVLRVDIEEARSAPARLEETTCGAWSGRRSTGSGSWRFRPARS